MTSPCGSRNPWAVASDAHRVARKATSEDGPVVRKGSHAGAVQAVAESVAVVARQWAHCGCMAPVTYAVVGRWARHKKQDDRLMADGSAPAVGVSELLLVLRLGLLASAPSVQELLVK